MKKKIIRKTNSATMINNHSSINDYTSFIKKKQQIVEKIALLLKNKFFNLFKEKGYSQKNLTNDLNEIITDKDLHVFDYNTLIIKIEKSILEILSKMESKEVKGLVDMNKINSLMQIEEYSKVPVKPNSKISSRQSDRSNRLKVLNESNMQNNRSMLHNRSVDFLLEKDGNNDISFNKHEKIISLKEKSKDEWALIAKHNYLKFLEDEREKKNKEEEMKRLQKQVLEHQMKEKELLRKKEKEETRDFYKAQIDTIKKMEELEKRKEIESKEKVKKDKQMQHLLSNQVKQQKEEIKKSEKIEDKKFAEKIKTDLMTDEEKLNQKRYKEKEVYLKLIKENEEKVAQKKFEKSKEKLENQKAVQDYSKHIDKLEEERKMDFHNRLTKIKGGVETFDLNIKKKEELVKQYEMKKLLKEQEEKEIMKQIEEEMQKEKKTKETEEMKKMLVIQMNEKRKQKEQVKTNDKQYMYQVKSNVDKLENEKKQMEKSKKNKYHEYKEELERQIKEKKMIKNEFMDDVEKEFNRNLINEILYEQ